MTVRNKTIQTIQDSFCDNINLKHGFNDQICLLYVSEYCVHIVVQILLKYVKTINEICYYILFHRFFRSQKYQKKFIFLY